MDWRPDNGAPGAAPRSFLYAVPIGGGATLLEETCLAGRPALDSTELRDRLHHRLRARGIELTGSAAVERVRFPVQGGHPGRHRYRCRGGSSIPRPATAWPHRSLQPTPSQPVHLCGPRRHGSSIRCAPPGCVHCSGCHPPTSRSSSMPSSPCPRHPSAPTCRKGPTQQAPHAPWAPSSPRCHPTCVGASRPQHSGCPFARAREKVPPSWTDEWKSSVQHRPESTTHRPRRGSHVRGDATVS